MTAQARSNAAPGGAEIRFRELVLLCGAMMAVNALSTDLMMPALPAIGRDLHVAVANDRQLIISTFMFGLGCGALLFGTLSDRHGRRRVLGGTLLMLLICTVACAGSHSFAMMLVGRALAGFFAGATRAVTVGTIRDRFRGDAMAQAMSLVVTVFLMVQVLAPSFGQIILLVAPWRWLFWVLALLMALVLIWMLLRLPETLTEENRISITPRGLFAAAASFVTIRTSCGYMLASGVATATLVAYVVSVQQIVVDALHGQRVFALAYACVSGVMMAGTFANSKLVMRYGARRLGQGALIFLTLMSLVHAGVDAAGRETIVTFVVLQSLTMVTMAFMPSNFSAIAMEPFHRGAGMASSFQAFVVTLMSTLLGTMVGRAFDGSSLPLSLGTAGFGIVALLIVAWADRGRLFIAPRRRA